MSTLSTRIKHLISLKELNISRFEKLIGVANNTIGTFIRRDATVSSDIIQKILRTFPDLNAEWLLTGQGEMLRSVEDQESDVLDLVDVWFAEEEDPARRQKLSAIRQAIAKLDMDLAMQKVLNQKLEQGYAATSRLLEQHLSQEGKK